MLQQRHLTDEVARRWPMIRSLVRVEHEVTKPNAQPTKETRYYISNLDFNEVSAKEIAYYIREHWGIENRLHLAVGCDFSGRCLPCAKELFGTQSESHPQISL